ncbi:MAG: D-alanyl-D-alanine dipeptidase [Leptolyngbyaceae cyanobacterium SM2_5_2]|nr:D-alanyl-D-alanine dipeptidase [Leptolyngbyaceae cyanobacterium SM2_5_2]
MRPYHTIAISDIGEPLVPIPLEHFAVLHPHPYLVLGAPYGKQSPYYLRSSVLNALVIAQATLQQQHPGWQIQIFDAYRPVVVQKFMVKHTFAEFLRTRQLQANTLTVAQQETLLAEVAQFWALPSDDPTTPPPHSTGAALDVTLVDEQGRPIAMGSPIDELSERSFPEHFAAGLDPQAQQYHHHRTLLKHVMVAAGFRRHPQEWWHFSLGDQLWAWILREKEGHREITARYGRIEPD